MSNNITLSDLPPLPSYTIYPQPPLISWIPDAYLSLLLILIAYWAVSMIFHVIDTYDFFPQYRLHTPAEISKRNRVSRWEVVRDVLIQQFVQTVVGIGLSTLDAEVYTGKDDYNVAVWAQRIRIGQRALPKILAVLGVDSPALAQGVFSYSPAVAGALDGGKYPWLSTIVDGISIPSFAPWETLMAKAIYWVGIPMLQFGFGIVFVDSWQYFLHRAMHMNRWLYTTFHSRHHRLYVPYAYGALYNHPFEGFLLDTLGASIAYLLAGLTPRQGMWFFTCATIKTVDDHCGYALPWDPLQHLTSNNAGYHDIHHQSWGIKTNFSQPFFTFWDRILGTAWTGGDVSARYEKARAAAEQSIVNKGRNGEQLTKSITRASPVDSIIEPSDPYANEHTPTAERLMSSVDLPPGKATRQALASEEQILMDSSGAGGPGVLMDEIEEESDARRGLLRRSPRKKSSVSATQTGGSLKGLKHRVSNSGSGFHGRTGGVLGYDTGR